MRTRMRMGMRMMMCNDEDGSSKRMRMMREYDDDAGEMGDKS